MYNLERHFNQGHRATYPEGKLWPIDYTWKLNILSLDITIRIEDFPSPDKSSVID